MSSKEEILSEIQKSIDRRKNNYSSANDNAKAVFPEIKISLLEKFIEEFEAIGGQVVLCKDIKDTGIKLSKFIKERKLSKLFCLDKNIQKFLYDLKISYLSENDNFEEMEIGFTSCELLIARTGSIIVSSSGDSGRRMNVFPPIHVVIANASQVVEDLAEGFKKLTKKYSNNLPSLISTITGASRTADIEKTLVMGAHGPKELIIFLNE